MRAKDLIPFVTALVNDYFADDVAEAIASDEDAFHGLALRLNRAANGNSSDMEAIVKDVADQVDDGTADWLVDGADSPAAYIASRIN